jgi:hypothetical protein
MSMKIISGLLFITTCVSLYFGTGWLFVMPRFPGESYFTFERMLSGIGLTLLSAALLVTVGWLWTRSGSAVGLGRAVANSFSWAGGAIVLFWLALMSIGGIRQG